MAMTQREQLKGAYGGSPSWIAKVNKMSDAQVSAIFIKLRNQNKI